jgi:putative membrane protein
MKRGIARGKERDGARSALMVLLALYAVARVLQIFPEQAPTLLIVVLQVLPPALFAFVHGQRVYGTRGILVFMGLCLATGTLFESLSLRTGFPFGHYRFTGVMGPKVFELPVLLALAWVGVGYTAWVVATLIVGARAHARAGVLLAPCLAAVTMTAWDLAMDPVWTHIDRAWVWLDGGGYFGVPFSNYGGWLLTTWVFYQVFAVWLSRQPRRVRMPHWNRLAVLMYGMVGTGNLLLAIPSAVPPSWPRMIVDAAGRRWFTTDIVGACVLTSVLVMGPLAAIAWIRVGSDAGFRRPTHSSADATGAE